jgi:hypothetical protein
MSYAIINNVIAEENFIEHYELKPNDREKEVNNLIKKLNNDKLNKYELIDIVYEQTK